ncbi:MAG: hypothetical protein EB141_10305 [Verrucomicrobia bacterium]|nr:hypothetical protein [Verrucomicrobiota bacterium]NBU11344.1 hypothetical protein [Pseudomonadota bacterium]NDA67179.1 hypothetical protein [Verrucomicrobiota bacterium]NDB76018.1 hypothetical protein [Verrucomicrobiota bacterium]NDD37112.1 hypothetical protein [Verrucomicrobiota bacterium]
MKSSATLGRLGLLIGSVALGTCSLASGAEANVPNVPIRSISLDVSVLRFKPLKAERLVQGFKGIGTDLKSVVDSLKADGEVSVLYNATRDMRIEDKAEAKFDALESRPVVIIGKPGVPLPPATQLGVNLKVTAKPADGERFGLAWEGSISWSPEMLTRWQGEKFLSFAGAAVSTLKTAGVIKGEDAKSADIGLSLAQLFNPKGKPTENEIYELPVNKTVSLSGSRNCKTAELIINATTAEMGSKEAQTLILLVLPTLLP